MNLIKHVKWGNVTFELFIVIVGVLIAVGIDDFLGKLNKKETAVNYLTEMLTQLEEDGKEIEKSIEFANTKTNALQLIMDTVWSPNIELIDINPLLDQNFYYFGTENNIKFQSYTLEAFKETGNFDYIKDDTLIQYLAEYEQYSNLVLRVDATDNRFIRDVIENYLYSNIPLAKCFPFRSIHPQQSATLSTKDWIPIFKETKLENLMLASIFRTQMSHERYLNVKKLNDRLIARIKAYLAKKG